MQTYLQHSSGSIEPSSWFSKQKGIGGSPNAQEKKKHSDDINELDGGALPVGIE